MRFPKIKFALLVCALSLIGLPLDAGAGSLKMRIDDGLGNGVVVHDTDGNGVLAFFGQIGVFDITMTMGLSSPTIGNEYLSELHLTNLVVNSLSTTGGSLTITIEDSGYTAGLGLGGPQQLSGGIGGYLSGPTGSSVTSQAWVNPLNLTPDLGAVDTTPGPLNPATVSIPAGSIALFSNGGVATPAVFGPGAFSGEAVTSFVGTGPYALFSQTTVTLTGRGSASFDAVTSVAAPEPASLVLFGSGLLGIARLARRRRAAARG